MNRKTRSGLMMVAGGYLVYLGVGLIRDLLRDRPDNFVIFMIIGTLFMIIGAVVAITNIKGLMKPEEFDETEEADEDEEDDTVIDEAIADKTPADTAEDPVEMAKDADEPTEEVKAEE